MERHIIAAASFAQKKYFFEPSFSDLPESVQEEIHVLCVTLAEKLECTFTISFLEDGDVQFEVIQTENIIDFDDIGAELEIKQLKKEKKELLKSLKLWYVVFRTEDGAILREKLLKNQKKC
ncbi:MAG: hypothetical protein KHZ62_01325 [Clostridiales bacterium]|nr:hypothetical protein [Clostridiales bacterium]